MFVFMHVCVHMCVCLKQIGGGVLGRVNSTCKGIEAETNMECTSLTISRWPVGACKSQSRDAM